MYDKYGTYDDYLISPNFSFSYYYVQGIIIIVNNKETNFMV